MISLVIAYEYDYGDRTALTKPETQFQSVQYLITPRLSPHQNIIPSSLWESSHHLESMIFYAQCLFYPNYKACQKIWSVINILCVKDVYAALWKYGKDASPILIFLIFSIVSPSGFFFFVRNFCEEFL